jgi:hypothetical protein
MIKGARKTITTAATAVAAVASGSEVDSDARSFILIPQAVSGIVHLGPPEDGSPLDITNSVRWDVSQGPFSIDLEPGEQLDALVEAGTLDVDVLSSGR